jgi:acyl-CoA synthetase (AMP-forming)/AMP-acid ligase II
VVCHFLIDRISSHGVCRVGGYSYDDLLHTYGLSQAGYIPQLFSLRLPNPDVIFELLDEANARALIFDPSFESVVKDSPVPAYLATTISRMAKLDMPSPSPSNVSPADVAFLFHTSGSTSGRPTLVPYSYRWLDSAVSKSYEIMKPHHPDRLDVTTWIGSICHVGQTFCTLTSRLVIFPR